MSIKLAVVMDPIEQIKFQSDTSFHFMLKAQKRGWQVFYLRQEDVFLKDQEVFAKLTTVKLFEQEKDFVEKSSVQVVKLAEMDIIMMRTDPPVNQQYIYTTYLLELVEKKGVLVVNRPQSLRDFNEKLVISLFPELTAPTMVSSQMDVIEQFIAEQKEVVVKPLDGLGGKNVFLLKKDDVNTDALLEMMTQRQTMPIMVQRYLPEVKEGDKRIFIVNGEPLPKMVVRVPQSGEIRSNIAAGGRGVVADITQKERKLCQCLAPFLRENGLFFVGIDMIGDYLSEINITSPTTLRMLEQMEPACQFTELILDKLQAKCHPG